MNDYTALATSSVPRVAVRQLICLLHKHLRQFDLLFTFNQNLNVRPEVYVEAARTFSKPIIVKAVVLPRLSQLLEKLHSFDVFFVFPMNANDAPIVIIGIIAL